MSDILDFYQEQAKAHGSALPWFAAIQKTALENFKRFGFPSRRQEEWKYTPVDDFLKGRFTNPKETSRSTTIRPLVTPLPSQIDIKNGQIFLNQHLKNLPPSVIVQPLLSSIETLSDRIKPYLGQLVQQTHGFQALNLAAVNTGVLIYLPEGVILNEPIVLAHWQDVKGQAIYPRHLIIAERGSQATVIETFHGEEGVEYFTNSATEIYLAAHAAVTHYKIQCESQAAFHIGQVSAAQEASSRFNSHSLSLGGKLVRSDLTIDLQQPGAECLMNGIYLPAHKQHVDHHTQVVHQAPGCKSVQDYKGVLLGEARAVFNGIVKVEKGAHHTNAAQQNKNLLLSGQAEINTKPQLEIFADDVVCSHGATVGQLDADALFYLATRGIGEQEASRFLIQAFAADNLSFISEGALSQWLSDLINRKLG